MELPTLKGMRKVWKIIYKWLSIGLGDSIEKQVDNEELKQYIKWERQGRLTITYKERIEPTGH